MKDSSEIIPGQREVIIRTEGTERERKALNAWITAPMRTRVNTACGCDWICNCGEIWIQPHALYLFRRSGYGKNISSFLDIYDPADDGPEIDIIKFFQAFPRGACAAPNIRTPLDTWRRICALRES